MMSIIINFDTTNFVRTGKYAMQRVAKDDAAPQQWALEEYDILTETTETIDIGNRERVIAKLISNINVEAARHMLTNDD